jgi:hypothetical protein
VILVFLLLTDYLTRRWPLVAAGTFPAAMAGD